MKIIELEEWGRSKAATLTDLEVSVAAQFKNAIALERRGLGRYRLSPIGGWVGSVNLSKETQVIIRSKVPLGSFFALTALAYQVDSLPSIERYSSLATGDPGEWLTLVLLSSIERLIRSGIRRGYVDLTERTAFVRGRIVFSDPDSFAHALPLCRYEDFSIDTIENRALKSALSWIESRPGRPEFHVKALQLLASLNDVQHVSLSQFALERIILSRLNSHYSPVLELIRLLQQGAGFSFAIGAVRGPGLFFSMHKIFEKAVYIGLRSLTQGGYVLYQPSLARLVRLLAGRPDRTPVMRPDVAISARPTAFIGDDSHTRLIVDAKYKVALRKTQYRLSFRSDDIYQIMAYSSALKCKALLIYPKMDEDIDVQYSVGDRFFRIVTVDLSDTTLTKFRDTLRNVAAYAA